MGACQCRIRDHDEYEDKLDGEQVNARSMRSGSRGEHNHEEERNGKRRRHGGSASPFQKVYVDADTRETRARANSYQTESQSSAMDPERFGTAQSELTDFDSEDMAREFAELEEEGEALALHGSGGEGSQEEQTMQAAADVGGAEAYQAAMKERKLKERLSTRMKESAALKAEVKQLKRELVEIQSTRPQGSAAEGSDKRSIEEDEGEARSTGEGSQDDRQRYGLTFEFTAEEEAAYEAIVQKAISAEEWQAVGQLRAWCDVPDAGAAIRYLRARNMDLKEAEKMWNESMKWRREFDVEHKCVEWCKELEEGETVRAQVCQRHWFGGLSGRDRWGLPINIIRFGTADPAGFVREAGFEALVLQYVVTLERGIVEARRLSVQKGEFLSNFVEIVDVGGDGIGQYMNRGMNSAKHMMPLAKILDLNYPERVRKVFMLKAPWYFQGVWNVVKPAIPEATKSKIGMYGSEGWTEELLEYMTEDNIPRWLNERSPDFNPNIDVTKMDEESKKENMVSGWVPKPFKGKPLRTSSSNTM